MASPRELAQKPKELVDKGSIAPGEVDLTHLSPGLFGEIQLIKAHQHEGLTSKQLVKTSFKNPPLRFVMVTTTEVLSTDPGGTGWTDLDLSTYVTLRTKAVVCRMALSSATAGRVGYARKNGSSLGQDNTTIMVRNPVAGQTHAHEFTVEVDNNGIFEWSVNNADVTGLLIHLVGYYEDIS